MSVFAHTNARPFLASAILVVFVIFFLFSGIVQQLGNSAGAIFDLRPHVPDFSRYIVSKTLSEQDFPLNEDNTRRVIVIGDIHGSYESFHSLLEELSYNPDHDHLMHVGDVVTKSTTEDSLAVLSYMTTNEIIGVRGNHDQKVIEWYSWMEWILSLPGGRAWLADIDNEWPKMEGGESEKEVSKWLSKQNNQNWNQRIPKGWRLLGEHYKIARAMTSEQYQYLVSLPLVLYVPSVHVFFVHAGLLPSDPHLKLSDPSQPLSHLPSSARNNVSLLRGLQEEALLSKVPQNQEPWNLLNIRSIKKDHSTTKSNKEGTPWSEVWNDVMDRCSGFDLADISSIQRSVIGMREKKNGKGHEEDKDDLVSLPCYPSTVVYGHAAARGLDVKRWSVGLDSGCVYGRRLSALVLDSTSFRSTLFESDRTGSANNSSRLKFGDNGHAQIASVKCP